MPIVSIAHANNTRREVETQSGGCFGFMAGSGFFHNHRRGTQWLAYHLESKLQADRCEIVFADNALFPYHKFMTPDEWEAFLDTQDFDKSRRSNRSTHGYIVIEMQPEGYEGVGIPQDMFISGLFTARQLSYGSFEAWMDATPENVHPMVAYALAEIFQRKDNGEMLIYRRSRQSSSNIDSTKFGVANLRNMIKYLRGDEDAVGYWGHEGGILQRGRYKRDSQFSSETEGFMTVWGWESTLNMNSLIAPINDDKPLIHAGLFSPLYLQKVLNSAMGEDILDVSNMPAKTLDRKAVKGDAVYGMYNETRPRYKKLYKKGQVVELRRDAVGVVEYSSSVFTTLIGSAYTVSGNYQNNRETAAHPTVYAGVLPHRTAIECIDKSRGEECIKLEFGTWVSPRMIKLVGVNEADGIQIPEPETRNRNREVKMNFVYQTANGKKALVRMYDMFDGDVRAMSLDDAWGVDEINVRAHSMKLVHE